MPLISCEFSLIVTRKAGCVISAATGTASFALQYKAYTKLYIPVETLSTQDNAKLLQQLISFKKYS